MGVVDILPAGLLGISPPKVLSLTLKTIPMDDQYLRTLPLDFSTVLPTISSTPYPVYLSKFVGLCANLCAKLRSSEFSQVRAAVEAVRREADRVLSQEHSLGANRQALEEWSEDLRMVLKCRGGLETQRMFRDVLASR
jgi:hypothetical protein